MEDYLKKYGLSIIFLIFLFLFMYLLNCLFPLYMDDYVYSYIWDGSDGWNMLHPLKENAQRVNSFSDIAESLWSHYFTWGGRIPAHVLVQFFVWQGKGLFNFLNALAFVFLILEIYWFSLGGRITFQLKAGRLAWIFFGMWACCPEVSETVLWLTGSCNYLWMMLVLLTFLLPYVRDYFSIGKMPEKAAPFMMFFGILAGWTNETAISAVILLLTAYEYYLYREKKLQAWMVCGEVGLCIGYALMLLAPGNFARTLAEGRSFNLDSFGMNLAVWGIVLAFQFVLWYSLRVLWFRKERSVENKLYLRYVRFFMLLSILSSGIMLFSPYYPFRSVFSSTVFLLIAVTSLIQWTNWREKINLMFYRFFVIAIAGYMAVTMVYSVYGYYQIHCYMEAIRIGVENAISEGRTQETIHLKVKKGYSEEIARMSGLHVSSLIFFDNKNKMINVDCSRYWGIDSLEVETVEE